MADATYQPKVYHDVGGDRLNVVSGGQLNIESGSSVGVATPLECAAGGYLADVMQTLTTTQTATNALGYGHSNLTGSTTGPTYTLAAPAYAGVLKTLSLAGSTAVTSRVKLNTNTTGVSVGTSGANQITLASSALWGATLRSISTTAWRVVGTFNGSLGLGNKTT